MTAPAVDFNKPDVARTVGADLERQAHGLIARLHRNRPIEDAADLAQAVIDRDTIAGMKRAGDNLLKDPIAMAFRLHQDLCMRRRAILDPLDDLDRHLAALIRDYHDREQQERRRLEAEAAEAARRQRETEALAEAKALADVGDTELAEAVVAEAIAAPAPIVVLPDPTAGIVTFTRRWKWKYQGGPIDVSHTPPDVLARAIAKLPADFLIPDEKKIGQYVRAMKGSGAIPGVDIFYVDEPNR